MWRARVLDDVRRGPGSAEPAKPAAKSCLAGPKSALGSLIFMDGNHKYGVFFAKNIKKVKTSISDLFDRGDR